MKKEYIKPIVEEVALESNNIICGSGNNKPGGNIGIPIGGADDDDSRQAPARTLLF